MSKLDGIPFWPSKHKPSRIVYSDASDLAFASFIPFENMAFRHGQTQRGAEVLSAVLLSLESFSKNFML